MVTFEDDEDPAAGSGEESQDEDETMEDADEGDADADATMVDDDQGEEQGDEDDNGEDNDDEDDDNEEPESPTQSRRASRQSPRAQNPTVLLTSPSPRPSSTRAAGVPYYMPSPRPEALSAVTYDIVPTMAAPQSTSINAVAATPDMRWVFSGGGDGYVRMYNWVDTANGKVPLTVAQKHPFVDSVMKAGSLTTYWENEETSLRTPPAQSADEPKETSPVYSLAVQHQALWLLSGLESGAINIQTCRHQAGSRIATLKEHTSAVSVLNLSADETGCLSGSWDKRIMDWDLNTGRVKRTFTGSGGQISAIEMRPLSSLPVPKLDENQPASNTFSSNNAKPVATNGISNGASASPRRESLKDDEDAMGSPDGSLFGENDHGSLFGDGDDGSAVGGGGGGFGDDDDEFGKAMNSSLQQPAEEEAAPATAQTTTDGEQTTEQAPAQPEGSSESATDKQPSQDIDVSMADIKPSDDQEQHPTLIEPESSMNGTHEPSTAAAPATDSLPVSLSTTDTSPIPQSESVFLDAAIDGTLRIWDRRVADPVARILPQRGTPPWCMGACWSPDGNTFYAGRRNGTVDEYSLHRGGGMAEPVRTLRFPAGSGAVSAVRAMANGRGLVCASYDILRLYDLKAEQVAGKHSTVPFLIVPGHRTGVISALHIDPSCRFMISTAGNRGWEGNSTEVLLGYEIGIPSVVG
ncbi:WD40 repeat-like protein [Myriangium duriaei CBS 260.36]|uniref:WD40 repeat-like protein n=1 Tax=Myriangium duriaei CBS 260.36 TaxID=1168546 RepID=A0A9P4J8K5_9PEZI|nr:WD40 repeat-like protein [Myriangium duriaei CBS 260.36]